jgi:hypothetical protein
MSKLGVSTLFLLTFGLILPAQTTSTEVVGVVKDASGLAVPGAAVTLTRNETGETRRAVTNTEGLYSFPLIEPGNYRVAVQMTGFKATSITDINVQLQQRARVDVTLQVGEVSQSVEVVAEVRLLNTEDAAVGQSIETKRIIDVPVAYRNIGHLAVMVPGVTFGTRMGRTTGSTGRTSPSGTAVSLVAHGQTDQTQSLTLDGVDVKEPRYNTMTLTPSIDAIAEFRVQTAAYSAEYGLGGGAHVQVAMKSGTNAFHGSLYEFHRNSALDAEDYFLNFELAAGETRRNKNALRRHQFGTFLGGPVLLPGYNGRNRTFWSFNYEGRRELSESVATGWFPSNTMRAGNFSELLNPVDSSGRLIRQPILIYDPQTGSPFPGNVIPAMRINAGAKNLLPYLPAQQFQQRDPLDFTNRSALRLPVGQNAWFVRGDHNFTDKDRAFVRLAWDKQTWDTPTINPNFGLNFYNKPFSLASQWIHLFSPTVLNELRFGLLDTQFAALERRAGTGFDQNGLGIGIFKVDSPAGPRDLTPLESRIPLIEGLGTSFGDAYGGGIDDIRVYNFANHITVHKGAHGLKAGFEYRRTGMNRFAANYPGGRIGFSALESGHAFASLLLGYANYAETPEGLPLTQPRSNMFSLYVLDDWKITPTLTANIGLRYDHFGAPYDAGGFWRSFDFDRTFQTSTGQKIPTLYPDALGEPAAVPLWSFNERLLMPRIGLAWRPVNKWVLRAGSGWYASTPHFNNFTILNLMPPYSGSRQFNSVTDAAQQVPVTAAGQTITLTTRRFRPGSTPLELGPGLFGGSAGVNPENLWYVEKNRRNHNHWTWTFDVQRELPLGTALTIGYVGSKSSHLSGIIQNWNTAPPSSNTNFQANRPVQVFHDPLRPQVEVRQVGHLQAIVNGLNSFYHGLTISLDKRYSRGLAYGFYYVFSKATGESSGSQDGVPVQNPRDYHEGRGPLAFDRRHVAIGNFVYELPWLRNSKSVAGYIAGGWQINGIIAFRSGFPFTVTQADDLNTGGFTSVRPDRIADGRLDSPSRKLWFDPSAFRRVTCNIPGRQDRCHYGNSGIGILNGPWQRNTDLSVFKNFPVPVMEGATLQLRLEAFNALNSPYFGIPASVGFSSPNSIVPDAPRMGEIRSLEGPMRTIQLGIKLLW